MQARFIAYDSVNPSQVARSELIINVLRNQNGPVFSPSQYQETIADTYEVGSVVLTVSAVDSDGVSITFFLIDQNDQRVYCKSPIEKKHKIKIKLSYKNVHNYFIKSLLKIKKTGVNY